VDAGDRALRESWPSAGIVAEGFNWAVLEGLNLGTDQLFRLLRLTVQLAATAPCESHTLSLGHWVFLRNHQSILLGWPVPDTSMEDKEKRQTTDPHGMGVEQAWNGWGK
jgi:hypothetical protein